MNSNIPAFKVIYFETASAIIILAKLPFSIKRPCIVYIYLGLFIICSFTTPNEG